MENFTQYLSSKLGQQFWIDLLHEWGFYRYPENPNDEQWLNKLCKYVYEGAPQNAYVIMSNCDGYFKLATVDGEALLFDQITDYRGSNTLESINGDTRDLLKDENYDDQCRVLIKVWDDVESIIPGLQQSRNKTWLNFEDSVFYGNTCLLKLKKTNRYRYVRGGYISEFKIDEPIEKFYSFMANNTVPEPIIVTKTRVYAVEHGVYFDRSKIDKDMDFRNDFVYSKYYRRAYDGKGLDKFKAKIIKLGKK
jgi:hypothetical protein